MKQLEVQIMGQSYLLGCPEGGELQLRQAVERVDGAMCKIRDSGKLRGRDRIAVLASLNLAFDLVQSEASALSTSLSDPQVDKSAEANNADSTRVAQLLKRLDIALSGDDHLI